MREQARTIPRKTSSTRKNNFKNEVLILAGISMILLVFGKFWAPQETYLLYTKTTGKLKSLENLIEIELKTQVTVQDSTSAKRYFDLFEKIMSDHNEEMRKLRGS